MALGNVKLRFLVFVLVVAAVVVFAAAAVTASAAITAFIMLILLRLAFSCQLLDQLPSFQVEELDVSLEALQK